MCVPEIEDLGNFWSDSVSLLLLFLLIHPVENENKLMILITLSVEGRFYLLKMLQAPFTIIPAESIGTLSGIF